MNTLYKYTIPRKYMIQWCYFNYDLKEHIMINRDTSCYKTKNLSRDYLNNCIKILQYK